MSQILDTDWQRIEREARSVAMAELERDETTPLAFGQHIAWMTYRHGLSDDTSLLHRVGEPEGKKVLTSCGDVIPKPICWLPLGSGLLRTLDRCRFCEAEYTRMVTSHAA